MCYEHQINTRSCTGHHTVSNDSLEALYTSLIYKSLELEMHHTEFMKQKSPGEHITAQFFKDCGFEMILAMLCLNALTCQLLTQAM